MAWSFLPLKLAPSDILLSGKFTLTIIPKTATCSGHLCRTSHSNHHAWLQARHSVMCKWECTCYSIKQTWEVEWIKYNDKWRFIKGYQFTCKTKFYLKCSKIKLHNKINTWILNPIDVCHNNRYFCIVGIGIWILDVN